jgi:transposase-like protein
MAENFGRPRQKSPTRAKEPPMTKRTEKAERKQGRRGLADANRLHDVFTVEGLRQMLLPLVTGAADTRRGLMEWSNAVGVEALKGIFLDDAVRIVGPLNKHQAVRMHHHWGWTPTALEFGGRRVSVPRPRVRQRGGGEVMLPMVRHLQSFDPLPERVLNQILLGVSTRGYDASIPPPPSGTRSRGTSRSAISRQLVRRMTAGMRAELAQPLDGVKLIAMMVDGIGIADHTIVVALGVTMDGTKIPLGLWQGSTENHTICTELLNNLASRGLKVDEPLLCVIDGGKGIRKALRDVFGDLAVIQRCQIHKRRNVRDHLPKNRQVSVDRQLRDAYASATVVLARKRLRQLLSWLERNGEDGAAGSLREGMEETLTVIKLDLPPNLRSFFATTNAIENLMGVIRKTTRNVKRWRSASMAKRWVSVAISQARSSFRRIKGHKNLPVLVANLRSLRQELDHQEQVS